MVLNQRIQHWSPRHKAKNNKGISNNSETLIICLLTLGHRGKAGREDIEALSNELTQTSKFKGMVIESKDSDYTYRMVAPRSVLAPFMASLIEELDYGNFKTTLPHSDSLRHDAYYKCWKVMLGWQEKMK